MMKQKDKAGSFAQLLLALPINSFQYNKNWYSFSYPMVSYPTSFSCAGEQEQQQGSNQQPLVQHLRLPVALLWLALVVGSDTSQNSSW